jgi:glutamate racemase
VRSTIGVFDSGVGGLSVVQALRILRPDLPIIYIADTAMFPYGGRSDAELSARALEIGAELVSRGCSLLVVACNTASSAALEQLRERFDVPIVGMEPPLKPAVERSRRGHVVVLATETTSSGARLARLRSSFGADAVVTIRPMAGLADMIEEGETQGDRVEAVLRDALLEAIDAGADAVALGCTHYAFVRDAIARIVRPDVQVIDASEPVARRVLSLLGDGQPASRPPAPERVPHAADTAGAEPVTVLVTGSRERFAQTVDRLRGAGVPLPDFALVQWEHRPDTASAAAR